jgi:hypothetical protein
MLKHLGNNVVKFTQKELLKRLIAGCIFRFGEEWSDVFLAVTIVYVLDGPVDHEDGFEEGVSGLGHPGHITTHEIVDTDLDYVAQFAA